MVKIRIFLALLIITVFSCSPKIFKEKWLTKQAPEVFKARFETTKGNFDIETHREWSPEAADRLYQLIQSGYYNNNAIYRAIPKFVAQFGIHNDSTLTSEWNKRKVKDEPVIKKNLEGTIAFARGGIGTRTTEIFINLKNNSPYLDTIFYDGVRGFPVIARVTEGMDTINSFYDKYGEKPGARQDSIQKFGNAYLKKNYPQLDYIKKAYILKKEK